MNIPKRQHWIPRLYLRAFAQPNLGGIHTVWCIPKDNAEPYRTTLDNVAVQKHLYSPRAADGSRSGHVEDLLANLESAVAPVWRVFADGELIDLAHPPYRQVLALFVAALHARHPARIEEHRRVHNSLIELLAADLDDKEHRPEFVELKHGDTISQLPTSEWEDYRDADEDALRASFVQNLQGTTKDLAVTLMRKRWTVLQVKEPRIITSDAPVMLVNASVERPGFRTPGTVIMVPVSPVRLLVFTDDVGKGNEYKWALDGMTENANMTSWLRAEKYIITSQDPDTLAGDLRRWMDAKFPD